MARDYSSSKLIDESQLYPYLVKMGQKEYRAYMLRVFKRMQDMKPGESFDIDNRVSEDNRDMFIKMLCLFIWMWPTSGEYLFNENFTVFSRRQQFQETIPHKKNPIYNAHK